MAFRYILLLLICTSAWGAYTHFSYFKPQHPRTVATDIEDLKSKLLLTGYVINDRFVNVTALIDGQISSIEAREGARVSKGDILAQLNSEQSEAVLRRAEMQVHYEETQIAAQIRYVDKLKELLKLNSISHYDYEQSEVTLQRLEAALNVAEADVFLAKLAVNNSTIKAPFDAIVTRQSTETGQWVEAGSHLFELASADGGVIEAYVDASEMRLISLGQNVKMTTDAWPGETWGSSLDWMSPVIGRPENINAPPNSFAVRFPLGDDAPMLLLGQRINVELETDVHEGVTTLPLSVLIENSNDSFSVWVADKLNEVALRKISIGTTTIDRFEIIDGLQTGDRVLSPNGVMLEEGIFVEPQ